MCSSNYHRLCKRSEGARRQAIFDNITVYDEYAAHEAVIFWPAASRLRAYGKESACLARAVGSEESAATVLTVYTDLGGLAWSAHFRCALSNFRQGGK